MSDKDKEVRSSMKLNIIHTLSSIYQKKEVIKNKNQLVYVGSV